jgi:hypothetical protein
LTEEPSGLNSPDKLPVDTNHKEEPVEKLVKLTPFSLETSDSELKNGQSKNSSRDAELSTQSESPWVKMEDQEDSLTLNSTQTPQLLKP